MKPQKYILIFLLLPLNSVAFSQEGYVDIVTQNLLDSLSGRIEKLHLKIKNFGGNRDARYFSTKRELDMTIFLREYEELIFNENLLQAQRLIDSRIKTSQKRSDLYAIKYYKDYQTRLTRLRGQKRAHYQQLFAKEKTFYKEYKTYIEPADMQAYAKTLRMLDLALKYANEKGYNEVQYYLSKYRKYTLALMLDNESVYDLDKLTNSESAYLKKYDALVEVDSLEQLKEAQVLVKQCFKYSSLAQTKLDSSYFKKQQIAAANVLADWNERQGISTELASLTGQSVTARRDSVNKEGIYQWNDLILVIGSLNFDSKSEAIRKGEAIIDADKTLYNYIRVNKLSKKGANIQIGKTYLMPVKDRDKVSYFRYDGSVQAWQYIVAYSSVISPKFTREMGRFLPPLQFRDSISDEAQQNEVFSQ